MTIVNFTQIALHCGNCILKERVNGRWECFYCNSPAALEEAVKNNLKVCINGGIRYVKVKELV